jgi:uncharacterized delta-60 repeat protein
MKRKTIFLLLLLFLPASPATAKPGDLDPTFNPPLGWVSYDDAISGNAVAIQADRKIVVVGTTQNPLNDDVLVLRYDIDGKLDASFGANGVILYNSDADYIDRGSAVAIQLDGKILVLANSHNGPDSFNIMLLRYEPDGSPDLAFGANGIATYMGPSQGADDFGNALAIQPNGKIVVAGSTEDGTQADLLVLRYNNDGTPDITFGLNGVVTYNHQANAQSQSNDYGRAIAIQPDGRIIVVGNTNIDSGTDQVLMVRFNGNGFLDTSFGGGTGSVTFATAGTASFGNAVVLDPDTGRIVVAGSMGDKYVLLLRYEANGVPDESFGEMGIVTYSNASRSSGEAIAIQGDGKLLVAGSTTVGAPDLLVLRYEDNGVLDAGFGKGGIVIFDSELYYSDGAASMALQADGKIVLAGTRENNMNADTDVLVLRLMGQEFPPGPSSREVFSYPPTVNAEMGTDLWVARPVGVGPVAVSGGNTLRLQIGLSPFASAVDVYFLVYAPALNANDMYVLHEDQSLQPLSNGLEPWKRNPLGPIEEGIFNDIPVDTLPKGIYNLYLGVTPSGTLDSFYLWATYFVIP